MGFNSDNEDKDTAAFILQDIDTVDYLGIARERFKMKFDRCNYESYNTEMYWIKGIGSNIHPFYYLPCHCDGCENNYTLLCLDSASVEIYKTKVTILVTRQ